MSSLSHRDRSLQHKTDFTWSITDEPHALRRQAILKAHPEISTLFGPDIRTFPLALLVVVLQICMAFLCKDLHWTWLVIVTYCVSATANHLLLMISHELTHNLCFHTPEYNQLLAVITNLPTAIPSAITFKQYHIAHHRFQGVDEWDMDLPTWLEAGIVGGHTVRKLLWIALLPVLYLRPLFLKPRMLNKWELFNYTLQLSFDFLVLFAWGWGAVFYMLAGMLMAVGFHPSGFHFIAEHYEFVSGTETYSYYGPINYIALNIGYHNEHHDFPKVAWSRLPLVKRMAPEFYESLPYHTSYLQTVWKFITDPMLGPFSRVKRKPPMPSDVHSKEL